MSRCLLRYSSNNGSDSRAILRLLTDQDLNSDKCIFQSTTRLRPSILMLVKDTDGLKCIRVDVYYGHEYRRISAHLRGSSLAGRFSLRIFCFRSGNGQRLNLLVARLEQFVAQQEARKCEGMHQPCQTIYVFPTYFLPRIFTGNVVVQMMHMPTQRLSIRAKSANLANRSSVLQQPDTLGLLYFNTFAQPTFCFTNLTPSLLITIHSRHTGRVRHTAYPYL